MLVLRKFARDTSGMVGLVIVLTAVVVAVLAPRLAPHPLDAYESHPLRRLQAPSDASPFGTDNLGRDVLSRVILGTRAALSIALLVVAGAMLIGVPLGLVAGYYRGWMPEVIMRVTDVFLAVPQLILALALAQLLGPSLRNAMLALTLTYWPFFTRIVFAETRRIRVSVFVEALEGLNAGAGRVMFAHILPNAAPPIIVRATIGMGFTILSAAVLGFLGMGATPPDPEWGLAIAESRQYLPEAWWFATFPGLAIFLVVFGFNLLGDGLRDVVDPRLRRSR
ncbi:MAG: ABC transporter permease [Candidatus Rokubacteria bacterium]|nr:ABC transporter permease [Candidatus Rokubacteria bacterium]